MDLSDHIKILRLRDIYIERSDNVFYPANIHLCKFTTSYQTTSTYYFCPDDTSRQKDNMVSITAFTAETTLALRCAVLMVKFCWYFSIADCGGIAVITKRRAGTSEKILGVVQLSGRGSSEG